eukprot:COSAG01_NODE_20325_length_959_cov_1.765116_1_plen_164_part_10
MSDAAATAAPNAHAQAMNEMIETTNKAEAEANRLKRKYEPDEAEVLLHKILEVSNHVGRAYMRVEIFTGECMKLTLIPRTRNVMLTPDWEWKFMPFIEGKHDNMEHIVEFGIYKVWLTFDTYTFFLLVTFDHKGVRIRELDPSTHSGDLRINVLPDKPEIALTH